MKTFCLCLPEYPDKIEKAKAHFTERGLENVEFFAGIHAEHAGLATSHTYERDHPASGFRVGFKITGVWLGHVMLWTHLARLSDDKFMIVEDDAQFPEDWKERFNRALSSVPGDFDLLYPGHCCLEGHPKTQIKDEVFEVKNLQCTHCYIINRKALPFLLRTIRKCWAPIDCQLVFEAFPHLRVFAVVPRIVSQFDTVIPP